MKNDGSHPIGGIDYPETLQDFDEWFPTEQACLEYLQKLRWPDGFVCPVCNGHKAWRMKTGLFRCSVCKRKARRICSIPPEQPDAVYEGGSSPSYADSRRRAEPCGPVYGL